MKIIQSVVLLAVVLGTSACASNAVKQQPAATLSGVPSTASNPSVPAADVAAGPTPLATQPTTDTAPVAPPADTRGSTAMGTIAGTSPAAISARTAVLGVNVSEATTQAEQDAEALYAKPAVRDPWEGFNRKMHGFNNMLDRFVLRPVAVGYDKVVPDPVQSGVSRFFGNLRLPATAVNQALQGRPVHAGQTLGRFVVNSTVGVAGVFDPATHIGVPKRDGEDFGQTLATWGWEESRYLVMPLLGPRTVRDTVAIVGDSALSPIGRIDKSSVADKLTIMQMVDGRAQMLPMDQVRKDALDDYTFVRDAWAQRRNRQIEQDLRSNRVE